MQDKHFYSRDENLSQWEEDKNCPQYFWNLACIWWVCPIWHLTSLDSLCVNVCVKYFRISDHQGVQLHSVSLESTKPTHRPKHANLQSTSFTYHSWPLSWIKSHSCHFTFEPTTRQRGAASHSPIESHSSWGPRNMLIILSKTRGSNNTC